MRPCHAGGLSAANPTDHAVARMSFAFAGPSYERLRAAAPNLRETCSRMCGGNATVHRRIRTQVLCPLVPPHDAINTPQWDTGRRRKRWRRWPQSWKRVMSSSYVMYCQAQAAECARRARLASSPELAAERRDLGLRWLRLAEKARAASVGRVRQPASAAPPSALSTSRARSDGSQTPHPCAQRSALQPAAASAPARGSWATTPRR
jgi:hypothetical protein